jgi:peptide-methionine (S)-S-oxide reductase
VIRTRVGYAGGTTANPTYENIGDYSESVQVDFDPAIISYDQLLQAFWSGHEPTYPSEGQYRSAILYNSEDQRKAAVSSKQQQEAKLGQTIYTYIEPLTRFYLAEDYHQKYYLQNSDLMKEISTIYPDPAVFRDSTAAARINGALAGYGNQETLKKEIGSLGLSPAGQKEILTIASSSGLTPGCPVVIPGK